MYFHLFVAILSWIIGLSFPALSDKYMVSIMIFGFIAFLLFLKESLEHVNKQFLLQAEEAERENPKTLPSFQGKFIMIRDDDSPFSDDFSYIIFNNGEIDVPLFCRNLRVIQKAAQANNELIIYYKNYILVDVEELE
jgi:5'(3')-deoxyribonucleotidase